MLRQTGTKSSLRTVHTRVIPKVSGLDVLNKNIFHNLYISETHILYGLVCVCCGYDVIVIYKVTEH